MNTRRKFSALVMAVLMSIFALAIPGQSQESRSMKRALEGSWRVTVTPGPNRPPFVPETLHALATYASGGGFVFTDNDDPRSGHGAWEPVGQEKFNSTLVKFLFDQGQLVATLHTRAKITVNSTQDQYTSEEVVEIRAFPSGFVLFAYNGATTVGTRIVVDPIE